MLSHITVLWAYEYDYGCIFVMFYNTVLSYILLLHHKKKVMACTANLVLRPTVGCCHLTNLVARSQNRLF